MFVLVLLAFTLQRHVQASEECEELPVFSPSRLVVKFGDRATATCSICNASCDLDLRLEEPFQATSRRGKQLVWNASSVTEWDVEPVCYVFDSSCKSSLAVVVYQPPKRLSLSFRNHTGPLVEGQLYSLLCEVWDVAPAQNVTVAFYRGLIELGVQSSSSAGTSPLNLSFSLDYSMTKEDHGAQFWCEARLELGLEGPQPSPVVSSLNITANVHYAPRCEGSAGPQLITVIQGQSAELNCSCEGNPQPVYSWNLTSGSMAPRGHVLTLHSSSSQHQGLYTCTATNALGALSKSFTLQVHVGWWNILLYVSLAVVSVLAVALVLYVWFYRNSHRGLYHISHMFQLHHHTAVPTTEPPT